MKILECQKEGIFDIGFVDPYIIHELMIKDFPDDIEENLLRFLKAQNTKTDIVFPYNFK
jgi:hypothetical protein